MSYLDINELVSERYQIKGDTPIEGGFAFLYSAWDEQLGRDVALKILKPEKSQVEWKERFLSEGKLLAQLNHPNVVHVYDIGIHKNNYYLIMEWIRGKTLNSWKETVILSEDSIITLLEIALALSNGVAAIHEKEIVHGDISPNNIILINRDNKWFPVIIDFGLSWNIKSNHPTKAKTIYYAAPEQFGEGHEITARADIYSLGAALFFLFSGQHYLISMGQDIERKSLENLIQSRSARSLQSLLGACNTELDDLLQRMLEKKPSDRPDILEVCQDLKAIYEQYNSGKPAVRLPTHSTDDSPEKIGWFTKRLIETRQSQGLSVEDIATIRVDKIDRRDKADHVDVSLFIPPGVAKHIRDSSLGFRLLQVRGLNGDSLLGEDQKLVSLLFDASKIYDLYLYNLGEAKGDPRIRLCLRTDTDNPNNLQYITGLKKTLVIECLYRHQFKNLMVIRVFLSDAAAGQFIKNSVARSIRFLSVTRNNSFDFPVQLLAEIQRRPEGTHYDTVTEKKVIHWSYYLATWKRLVEEKKFEIRYSRYILSERSSSSSVTFYLSPNQDIPWERIRASIGQPLLLKIYPKQDDLRGEVIVDEIVESRVIGTLESFDRKNIALNLHFDAEFLRLGRDEVTNMLREDNTYIAYDLSGDSSQIRRQQEALTQLVEGRMANPYLDSFIFDASQARDPGSVQDWIPLRRDKLLIESITDNPSQFAAVENALNAPDLYLIQGPPGTGKTTVIAELCYQSVQRGERVLIASQTNLAVDKALSKLGHRPNILALRIGNVERIEPEGMPYTEDNVVRTWFEKTANNCIIKLNTREQTSLFSRVFEDQEFLTSYADFLRDHPQKMNSLQMQIDLLYERREEAKRLLDHQESNFSAMHDLVEQFARVTDSVSQNLIMNEPEEKLWLDYTIKSDIYQKYLSHLVTTIQAFKANYAGEVDEILRKHLSPVERLKIRKFADGELSYPIHRITAIFKVASSLEALPVKSLDIEVGKTINPSDIWNNLFNAFQRTFELTKQELEALTVNCSDIETELNIVEKAKNDYLDREEGEYGIYSSYWEQVHNAIPEELLDNLGEIPDINTPEYIQVIIDLSSTNEWQKRHQRERLLTNQTPEFVRDWIDRLNIQDQRDVDEMKQIYLETANIIGITCGQAYRLDRNSGDPRPFDVVIVDEVSKATPPELLMPILRAKKIVLVGDHKQLPPMVLSETLTEIAETLYEDEDELAHLKQSLFKNLFESGSAQIKTMLTKQYRMRQPIMRVINQFYGDELTGGHDRQHGFDLGYLQPDDCLLWASTPIDNTEVRLGTSYWNEKEVKVIEKFLQEMDAYWQTTGNPPKEVGVITFYGQQAKEFERRFQSNRFPSLDLRIGTVDRFQGIERQIVIVSLVRNNNQGQIGFAKEKERVNVAFSRAQELLIIVGCKDLFTAAAINATEALNVYSRVVEVVKKEGKIIDVSEFDIYR